MPVFMRRWSLVLLPLILPVPAGAGAEYAQGVVQWRGVQAAHWQVDMTLHTAASVTEVVEHILAVDAYGAHSDGQLTGSMERSDGRRYLAQLHERRAEIPAAIVSDTSLELTVQSPAHVNVRVFGGPYDGLRGAWRVRALPEGGTWVAATFEIVPPQQVRQRPYGGVLQHLPAQPVIGGWLQLWGRALGLPTVGP